MIQPINISLIPSDNKPVINVSQYDNGLRVLRFNIFDDIEMEVPHEFDGETVTCNIRKNDNNIVVITGTIETETTEETETSFVQVVLTEQACACVGSNYGEISLSSGDDVIGTCNFKLIVERSPLAGGVTSQTAIDNLTTQIEEIASQVIGDDYYNKTEVDGLIDDVESEIPTKTSELENDSGFITDSDIPTIPTKTSQLTNDSGFITASDIPTIPTKTSQLTNDSGFTTIDDTATVSDKTWSSNKINNEFINLLPTATASGNPANFTTSYVLPLEFIKAYIVATGGNGTPSAPIPVTGFDSVTITQADENMQTVETVVINLGQTVYGGYVTQDKNGNRKLVVTWLSKKYMDELSWSYNSGSGGYFSANTPIDNRKAYGITNVICDIYKTSSSASVSGMEDLSIKGAINSNSLYIKDSNYTDATLFTQSLQGKYITYEINNPFTVELTDGESFNALLGVNNISSNSGDCEVTYKCSIDEAINAAIASQSNRSLSLARNSNDTLLGAVSDMYDRERGETDDQK